MTYLIYGPEGEEHFEDRRDMERRLVELGRLGYRVIRLEAVLDAFYDSPNGPGKDKGRGPQGANNGHRESVDLEDFSGPNW
jgi:hypothetical protein